MRSLNKLYEILYNEIKDKIEMEGLCYEIGQLGYDKKITISEVKKLYSHFEKNKPTKKRHSEFLKSDTWVGGLWWWNHIEVFNPVNRIAFVKKMMKITKRSKS